MKKRVLIVGAGPAGLFCGANMDARLSVLILEKMKQSGIKLLLSGKGRCNLTHSGDIKDFVGSYGENGKFLYSCFSRFFNMDLLDFFCNRGVDFIQTEKGKYFPKSKKSISVLEVLLSEAKNHHELIEGNPVKEIKKKSEGFEVFTENGCFSADFVVVATGGKSYPQTGSSGDGYGLARSLGHNIITPKPGLVPVIVRDYPFENLSGNSFYSQDVILKRGKKKRVFRGDLLLTENTFSGPVILHLSRYFLPGDRLSVPFLKLKNVEEFKKLLIEGKKNGKKSVKNWLKETFKLPGSLCGLSPRDDDREFTMGRISMKQGEELYAFFNDQDFVMEKTSGFEKAMVTVGGVDLKEVDGRTMESKIVPGLFFAGEVLDIDGDTGGYNLQAAFSTAYAAAVEINDRL